MISYEPHQGVQRLVRDLNHLIRKEPALFELDFDHRGFEWIDHHDADSSVLAYLRRSKDGDFVVIAINFTPVPRPSYSLGVPAPGQYRELINTDSSYYGGSNLGNDGEVTAIEKEQHGRPFSISVTLPPCRWWSSSEKTRVKTRQACPAGLILSIEVAFGFWCHGENFLSVREVHQGKVLRAAKMNVSCGYSSMTVSGTRTNKFVRGTDERN